MASATVTPTITTFRVQRPIVGDVSYIPYIPPGSASLQSQRRTQPSKARQLRKPEPDVNSPNRTPVSISADACVALTNMGEDVAAGKGQEGAIIIDDSDGNTDGNADGGADGDASLDTDSELETLSQIIDGWAPRGETTTATSLAGAQTGTQGDGDSSVERESATAKDAGEAAVATVAAVEAAATATLPTGARQQPQGGRGEADESDQLQGTDASGAKKRKRSFFGNAGSRSIDCEPALGDGETLRQSPTAPSTSQASSCPYELSRKRRRLSDQCAAGQRSKPVSDAGNRSMSVPHTSDSRSAARRGESAKIHSTEQYTTGGYRTHTNGERRSTGTEARGHSKSIRYRHGRSSKSSWPSTDLAGSGPPAAFSHSRLASPPTQSQLELGIGEGDGNGVSDDSDDDNGGAGLSVNTLAGATRSAEDAARASDADNGSQPILIVTDGAGNATGRGAHRGAGIAANSVAPRAVRPIPTQSKSGSECATGTVISHAVASGAESSFQNERLEREGSTAMAPAICSLQRTVLGVSLLSFVVKCDRSIRKSLHEQSVALARDMLGEAISIEQLVMKPLPHSAWHLTAYVYDAGIAAAPSTEIGLPVVGLPAAPLQDMSANARSALNKGSRPPRKTSRIGARRPIADDTSLSDSDSSSGSDSDWPLRTVRNVASRGNNYPADEDHDGDEHEHEHEGTVSEDDGTTPKKRGRWTLEEERLLRRCVESGMKWPKIAARLGRSQSAVKQHWRIMNLRSK